MAGWGAAARVGPHGTQGEDQQLLCLKSVTLPEKVWRTDAAHQGIHREVIEESPQSPKLVLKKRRRHAMCTQTG